VSATRRATPGPWRAGWATASVLWRRDLWLLVRQRSRLLGALAPPFLFWLVLGSGLAPSFRAPGAVEGPGYLEYFFPGVVLMVVLFASISTTMSVIEDRREGFLQGVLAAPGGRGAVALGKTLGGATVALLHAALFLLLSPLAGSPWDRVSWGCLAAALALSSLLLTAVGFVLAWWLDSTQGYHAIMNVVLVPLWVVSGALFPIAPTHEVLRWVACFNPLSYAVDAVRTGLTGGAWADASTDLVVLAATTAVALLAAARSANR
jgi:daunorubicin resistance ABC transporter membrane protein